MHYILVARPLRFWLVGPFDTEQAAADWARNPAHNPNDDPRWQVLRLAHPEAPVEIVSPLWPLDL